MGYFDCHLHTSFSGDSEAAPEAMIESAIEKGLSGITVTDHLDIDYRPSPGEFDLDIESYIEKLSALKKHYDNENFTILIGIELGIKPSLSVELQKIVSSYPFDFVIGSVHVVDENDPYYDSFYNGKTADEAYESYFRCVLENLNAFSSFDSLGHLDYILRYGIRHYGSEDGKMEYERFSELTDRIFSFILEKEIALDINTAPLSKGFQEPNPSYRLIERYFELGGRQITLGADAHRPENIGMGFERTADKLKKIGFTDYSVFKNRETLLRAL